MAVGGAAAACAASFAPSLMAVRAWQISFGGLRRWWQGRAIVFGDGSKDVG